MKIFKCAMDDGYGISESIIVSKNKKTMLKEYGGNGEFLKITDVTNDYKIDMEYLERNLMIADFGRIERTLILELLEEHFQKNV